MSKIEEMHVLNHQLRHAAQAVVNMSAHFADDHAAIFAHQANEYASTVASLAKRLWELQEVAA